MSYKVYQYIFPDGKMYIGTTKNSIATRRDQGYQHNKPLQKAMRAVGWQNIKAVILADGLSQSEAFKAEKRFITEYHSDNPNIGYNVSNGGKATYKGLKHTKEYRQYMSNLYKGRSFSEKTLSKMRESHKKERKAVLQYSIDNEFVAKHNSLSDAAKVINGYKSNISRACVSGKIYKNSLWKFERR